MNIGSVSETVIVCFMGGAMHTEDVDYHPEVIFKSSAIARGIPEKYQFKNAVKAQKACDKLNKSGKTL